MIFIWISLFLLLMYFAYLLGKFFVTKFKFINEDKWELFLFSISIGIGLWGFFVYLLGVLGILYSWLIIVVTAVCYLALVIREIKNNNCDQILRVKSNNSYLSKIMPKGFIAILFSIVLLIMFIIALFSALSPEIEFDSLWYHLEEPKTYLLEHKINYYPMPSQVAVNSLIPRLIECDYAFMMSFGGGAIMPKLFSFILAIGSGLIIFLFSRRFFNLEIAFLSILILFSIGPIQWLLHSSYIDFGSLFFGSLSFYAFYRWWKENKTGYLSWSALLTGLAMAVKLWNILLLPTYLIFILWRKEIKLALRFLIISLLPALPFYTESFYYTKNPFFPVFSVSDSDHLSGAKNIKDWLLVVHPRTFWNYIYDNFLIRGPFVIFLPMILFFTKSVKKIFPLLLWTIIFLFLWTYIPVHEFRYGLSGLMPLVVITSFIIWKMVNTNRYLKFITYTFLILYLSFSVFIFYRLNDKFIPPLLTEKARADFLVNELGSNKLTFYDSNGYFKNNIIGSDKVMTFVHNMFYIDFPYYDGFRLTKDFAQFKSENDLMTYLKSHKFTYVLLRGDYKFTTIINDFMPGLKDYQNWINRDFKIIYWDENNNTILYKIIYPEEVQ